MKSSRLIFGLLLFFGMQSSPFTNLAHGQTAASRSKSIQGGKLSVEVFDNGSYALRSTEIPGDVLRADVEVDTAGGTLQSSLYPRHSKSIAPFTDELGSGHLLTVTHTGLEDTPDLICAYRVYEDEPWGDIQVTLHNTTGKPIVVHAIHVANSSVDAVINLDGTASADRILSDNFSENPVQLMDLGEPANGLHVGFGSQLIYNRESGKSLFFGALSAGKFLTGFHLHSTTGSEAHVLSYDIEDEGTDEVQDRHRPYPSGNPVPFQFDVPAGGSVATERLMFSIGSDYHAQLENYGRAIRILFKPPVSIPSPTGWWSWTSYYYGVSENAVLTNAAWLKQNLGALGYKYCFVDEGYQYARGEYATSDAYLFPQGVGYVGHRVDDQGLTFGLWTAPFEVSDRSWVYEKHKDWLVHNAAGEPIHIGRVGPHTDFLYALDTTNPGAQDYLRYTYRTLTKGWGTGLIKMDFMDTSAIEGVHYRPNTTALEAERIGLQIIRDTVGDGVVLDKDGSFMLTPVGIVNAGRTGQDTGHTFGSTHDAATGLAARYYMNRNFYITDPDAFTVSKQVMPDRGWHRNQVPLTLDEAEDSIALAAVTGGMFEIGDDLPTLGASPDRVALVKNPDLLDMVHLSRASLPFDLMTYRPEDKQPSIFLLKETPRQQILTVFNWTEETRSHTFGLADLGLNASGSYTATDVLRGGAAPIANGKIAITLPPHTVRMLKLVDASVPETAPAFDVHASATAQAGSLVEFHAAAGDADAPVLEYHWDFGDGVSADGVDVSHAYTYASQFTVTVTGTGVNKRATTKTHNISVTGDIPIDYVPNQKVRFNESK